jgi:uncharacterized repeat protein (TIGR03803 family)
MSTFAARRHVLSICAAAALLAGCGGLQPPLGVSPQGVASRQSPRQAYAILHKFGGPGDGWYTVFRITRGGREKVVHSFGRSDGSRPYAGLIDVRGTLYGTTSQGGSDNVGTIFSITTSGKEYVLHSFGNGSGKHPVADLLELGRTLYGTTYGVTGHRSGNVFSLTP